MTNFEAMKAKIIQTINAMDEMELYEFVDNTDMDMGWIEGVFNCSICKDKYGDCSNFNGTEECKRRYKDWCSKGNKGEIIWLSV